MHASLFVYSWRLDFCWSCRTVQTIAACGVRLSKRFHDDYVSLLLLGVEFRDLLSDGSILMVGCTRHILLSLRSPDCPDYYSFTPSHFDI